MKKKNNVWYGMRIYNILSFDKVNVIEEKKGSILVQYKDGSTQWFVKKSTEHIYTKSRFKTAAYIHTILTSITNYKKKAYLMNKSQQEEFERLHKKFLGEKKLVVKKKKKVSKRKRKKGL